jgi:hypothetical protein
MQMGGGWHAIADSSRCFGRLSSLCSTGAQIGCSGDRWTLAVASQRETKGDASSSRWLQTLVVRCRPDEKLELKIFKLTPNKASYREEAINEAFKGKTGKAAIKAMVDSQFPEFSACQGRETKLFEVLAQLFDACRGPVAEMRRSVYARQVIDTVRIT